MKAEIAAQLKSLQIRKNEVKEEPMPEIPKRPAVPNLSEVEMAHIESIVFLPVVQGPPAQAVLIFGGTHPGAWLRTIEAHQETAFDQIFVTGGHKRTGVAHHSWTHGERPEAEVICEHLLEAEIPPEIIHLEKESENSRDNVVNIRDQINRYGVKTLALVFRSYGSGRQTRTFRKHLPEVSVVGLPYDTDINEEPGIPFGRHNWKEREVWRSVVWGEYLRIVEYGRRGDLVLDFEPLSTLVSHLKTY